jgi:hypothetical protein
MYLNVYIRLKHSSISWIIDEILVQRKYSVCMMRHVCSVIGFSLKICTPMCSKRTSDPVTHLEDAQSF